MPRLTSVLLNTLHVESETLLISLLRHPDLITQHDRETRCSLLLQTFCACAMVNRTLDIPSVLRSTSPVAERLWTGEATCPGTCPTEEQHEVSTPEDCQQVRRTLTLHGR